VSNSTEKIKKLQDEILKLKDEKDFVLLAHNYQLPEIQEIADFCADSLQLANHAKNDVESQNVLFAAVKFMAESGAILNPSKNVYVANPEALCPMARMAPVDLMKKVKQESPDLPLMMYINTTAAARAQADFICTSANSLKIAKVINKQEINFAPDKNLAYFIQTRLGIKVNPVPITGHCTVHESFKASYITNLKKKHPNAITIVHPECPPEVQQIADFIGSTSQMEKFVKTSDRKEFIVGTEVGLIDKLKRETEGKIFYKAHDKPICYNMKKNTLETINDEHLVKIPEEIAKKNRQLLNDMLKNSE